jgi:hypothetical protein
MTIQIDHPDKKRAGACLKTKNSGIVEGKPSRKTAKLPKTGLNKSKLRKKLIVELDRLVSLIVRKRDKRCVTTGSMDKLTCSHLIKRGKAATRFDLTNCNCQTLGENFKHNQFPEHYTKWWINKYGLEAYNELIAKSIQPKKWTVTELQALKAELQKTLEGLQ